MKARELLEEFLGNATESEFLDYRKRVERSIGATREEKVARLRKLLWLAMEDVEELDSQRASLFLDLSFLGGLEGYVCFSEEEMDHLLELRRTLATKVYGKAKPLSREEELELVRLWNRDF